MGYEEWFRDFARRHRAIVEKLSHLSDEELVDYFDYDHMRIAHPDFCPLYRQGLKCHAMENLNCYLCGCPYFRFCDEGIDRIGGKVRYSLCSIDARGGGTAESAEAIHQDCSGCLLPHRKSFILRHFDRDWSRIMKDVDLCPKEPDDI